MVKTVTGTSMLDETIRKVPSRLALVSWVVHGSLVSDISVWNT
jgi:hypothetical protein